MGRRTGIREIAAQAGVSEATVSLALRDKGRMSEETRGRIKEIAASIGYLPNSAARSLTSGRTGLIGISIPVAGEVPEVMGSVQYFFRLLGAAAAKAIELDFGLLVSTPGKRPVQPAMDGAIVVDPALDDPFVAACDKGGLPVVTIGRRLPGAEPVPERTWVVDNDFVEATGRMLDHLDQQGSRSPALLAAEPIDSFQQDSIDSYLAWCERRGKSPRVVIAKTPEPGNSAEAADQLFDEGERPDGVYATIDTLARAVLDRASADGIDVPGQLRVATCSNGELTRTAEPGLTTIDENPPRLGEAAVELLVAAILDPESAPTHIEVGTELLLRESTA